MPQKWFMDNEALDYLARQKDGRLATCDAEGQPYITPLNYVVHDGKIYIHCAHEGKKLTNIANNPKVCFEVSHTDKSIFGATACQCSTRYTSVLVFGVATVVENVQEKVAVLNALARCFASGQSFEAINSQAAGSCTVVAIRIDSISGKRNVDPATNC